MIRQRLQQGVAARLRTLLRFEPQDASWNLAEWERHSNAWAFGLAELGLGPSARVLSWVDPVHTAELAAVLIGSAKLGAELRSVDAELRQLDAASEEGLRRLLAELRPDLLVFSPHQPAGGGRREELVRAAVGADGPLLVHTGFYSKPGMARFRDVMLYRSRACSDLPELDCDERLRAAAGEVAPGVEEVTFNGPFDDYPRLLGALVTAALCGVFTRLNPAGCAPRAAVPLQARTLLELEGAGPAQLGGPRLQN